MFGMLILFAIRIPEGEMKTSGGSVRPRDLLELIKNKDLSACYTGIILSAASAAALLTYLALYLETLKSSISTSLFFSIYGISGIIGSALIGYLSNRIKHMRLVFPLILIFGTGLVILGINSFSDTVIFLAVPIFTGFGYSGSITNYSTWIVDSAPGSLRASAFSFQESSLDIGTGLGSVFFGMLAMEFYYAPLFIGLGLFTFSFPLVVKLVRR